MSYYAKNNIFIDIVAVIESWRSEDIFCLLNLVWCDLELQNP